MLVVKAKQVWLGQKLERKSTSFCPIFLPVFIDAGEPKSVLGTIWGYFQNEKEVMNIRGAFNLHELAAVGGKTAGNEFL